MAMGLMRPRVIGVRLSPDCLPGGMVILLTETAPQHSSKYQALWSAPRVCKLHSFMCIKSGKNLPEGGEPVAGLKGWWTWV